MNTSRRLGTKRIRKWRNHVLRVTFRITLEVILIAGNFQLGYFCPGNFGLGNFGRGNSGCYFDSGDFDCHRD
jgi:hypothetical protein